MADERQQKINELAAMLEGKAGATPFYLMAKGEPEDDLDFGTHFNPKLAQHSDYFMKLKDLMQCAKMNGEAANKQTVCAKEFKALRLAGFNDQLLYHHVNKSFFMQELAMKNGESPY